MIIRKNNGGFTPTQKKIVRGFTLVELILYIALVSIFVTSAIMFSWDVIYGREKAYKQLVVQQVSRMAIARIGYEISAAKDIQSVQNESISLIRDDGTVVTIAKSNNGLQITTGTQGPYTLTSNEVTVSSLQFTNLTSATKNAKNINVSLSLRQANNTSKGELTSATSVTGTFELKGRFNLARSMLLDTTNLSLSGGTSVAGLLIQNLGTTNFTISKLKASWTNPTGDNITGVAIGGSSVWSGSSPSGVELTLNPVNISPGTTNINSITFSSSQYGEVLDLQFTLSDGSLSFARLFLPSSSVTPTPSATPTPTPTTTPTPTPTVTPTPTPAGSCIQVCLGRSYTLGTCRKNAAACTTAGETYISAGDIYCTGGPNADTCCCK